MRRINKYIILGLILMGLIMVNVILYAYPISIDRNHSLIDSIPYIFWILLIAFSGVTLYMAYKSRSQVLVMFLSSFYFFLFYSFNLFFMIIPEQSDIGATSLFMNHISTNIYIDPYSYPYFTCPVFFTFSKLLMDSIGLSQFQTVNLGFFLMLMSIPLILPLSMVKHTRKNPMNFIIYPALYIILSFFFINSQFVPQFIGLIFLILTIGSYVRLQETGNSIFFYITLMFFILCVYSHPFMFIFFLLALLFEKTGKFMRSSLFSRFRESLDAKSSIYDIALYNIKGLIGARKEITRFRTIFTNWMGSFVGMTKRKSVSLVLLLAIYIHGFQNGFYRFEFFNEFINPQGGRGETWFLVSYLLGSKEDAGLTQYEIYPLYDLVSENVYLTVKYLNIILLMLAIIIIFMGILKVSRKKVNPFDIYLTTSSVGLVGLGLFMPAILGQRAIQVMFLNIPQYVGAALKRREVKALLAAVLLLSPFLFTMNTAINSTIGGFNFVEDDGTLTSGSFVTERSPGNRTVFTSDRSFYPVQTLTFDDPTRINRETPETLVSENMSTPASDYIIMNEKVESLLDYHGYSRQYFINYTSCIYDQGNSRVFY